MSTFLRTTTISTLILTTLLVWCARRQNLTSVAAAPSVQSAAVAERAGAAPEGLGLAPRGAPVEANAL